MTIPQYIDFTEKRLQAEAELLANLKAVQAQNEQLQQQMAVALLKPQPRVSLPALNLTLDIPIFEGIGFMAISTTFEVA